MKPVRTAAQRLTNGTGTLAGEFGHWLLPGEFRTAISRLAGSSVGGALAWTVVDREPRAMAVAAAAGLAAAWKHGAVPATEPEDGREQPEPDIGEPEEPPLPDRQQLAAALHHVADPHAHLASIARHLGYLDPQSGKAVTGPVRAGLDAAGIPVSGGCREGGSVSTGVKRDDFPPPPALSGTGVVAEEFAGQPDNNTSNNNTSERKPYLSREGFWITPDPARPHGWNVRREEVTRR